MALYRVNFVEKTYYEVYVDADSTEEAEKKAEEAFGNGDESVEVTDQYVADMCAEEEA